MNCPICPGSTLLMTNRDGVEIDYCPTCRGVWLDRGELDKIIERNAAAMSPRPSPIPAPRRDDDHRSYDDGRDQRKKKKGSFLGDLFEF